MNTILVIFEKYVTHTFQITLLFIIATLITIFIFQLLKKLIEKKSKPLKSDNKNPYVQEFFLKSDIKEILKKIKIKFHFERTFIRYNTIFCSLQDIHLFNKKNNQNIYFKIFHELSHKYAGDTFIGGWNIYLNRILFYTITIIYLNLFFDLFQTIIAETLINILFDDWNQYTAEFYTTYSTISAYIFLIISFYLAFKIFNKWNLFSYFRESVADRYAYLMVNKYNYNYSWSIFDNSESINHPNKNTRILSALGKSNINKKIIIYYTVFLLASIFPSILNKEFSSFSILQLSLIIVYSLLILTIYKVNFILFDYF